jgi:hypothetical protein
LIRDEIGKQPALTTYEAIFVLIFLVVGCVFRRKWTGVPIECGQPSERSDARVILC